MSSKLRKFIVLAGKHYQNDKGFKKGDAVYDVRDLVKMFPCKFSEDAGFTGKAPVIGDVEDLNEKFGKEVTIKYALAAEKGLRVFFREKRYTVTSADGIVAKGKLDKDGLIEYLEAYQGGVDKQTSGTEE